MKVRRSEAKEERAFVKRRKLPGLKGHGPRHADANTDTVPAMLTPREAVLNRNAAELAGRENIEALNAQGNKLAKKGVDLASGGGKSMKEKKQKLQEGGYAGDWQGEPLGRPEMQRPAPQGGMDAILAGRPNFTATQWYNPAQGAWQARRPQEQPFSGGGPQPMPLPQPTWEGPMPYRGGDQQSTWQGPQPYQGGSQPGGGQSMPSLGGGFYPPEQGPFAQNKVFRGQAGTTEVQPIGTPAGGQVYGPPIQLSAPDILSKLQAAGKEQGLSSAQINGLMQAFKGAGQAFNQASGQPYDQLGGAGASFSISGGGNPTMGYAGGISDIGYPPFVAPNAQWHGDKSSWQGPYDPNYFIPNYG